MESPVSVRCEFCKTVFEKHPKIIRYYMKHRPDWKLYCSNVCKGMGLRGSRGGVGR